jgi:hypothetical protein
MDVWYDTDPAPELLERLLLAPLAERARSNVESKLSQAARNLPGEGTPI